MKIPLYVVIDEQYTGSYMIIEILTDKQYAIDFVAEGIKNGYLNEKTVKIIYRVTRG